MEMCSFSIKIYQTINNEKEGTQKSGRKNNGL